MKPVSRLLVAAVAAFAAPVFAGEDHSRHMHQQAEAVTASAVKVRYDDSVLTDQGGRALKLKSDVIGDRIVVIDFVYTTCTTICPVLTTVLGKVQSSLDEKARADVRLVSISVDPARDTPARLKEYGAKFGVQSGWVWLTGPTGRVSEVLKGFGAYAPNFEDHPPLILVGDGRTGEWTRFFGFADPQDVLTKVQELRSARAGVARGHAGHADHADHKH